MKFGGFLYIIFSKTNSCAVYTAKTWSDFAESHQPHAKLHQLRTMNAGSLSTPSSHFQFNQKIFWTNCVHSWYGVSVTAFIHGTELMRFGKATLRSTKLSIKWLWPVKVTLEVIKQRLMVFCWSCDEGSLNKTKIFRASSLPVRIKWVYSRPSIQMAGQFLQDGLCLFIFP
jgi:hypothetical protein